MTPFVFALVALATNLPPIVVEATRIDSTQMATPCGVQVIDGAEVVASGSRNAVELLSRRCPRLHVRQTGAGNPALAEIALRGYGENGHGRTLVLLDGERLNSTDLNAPDLSRIALSSVRKIEILSGPQTVLYGNGASAGVINILTDPMENGGQKTSIDLHGGSWGSFGGSLGTRGRLEEEDLLYWANGSWNRSDGYRSQSQYNLWNADAGVLKEWENGTSLRFSGFFNDAQYDLPGYLTYDEWKDDPRQSHANNDRYHRASYGVNATFEAHLNEENALRTTALFSNRRMWAYQQGEGWYSDNTYDIYSTRLTEEWINSTDIFGFENEFLLGIEYGYEHLRAEQFYDPNGQFPQYDRQNADAFAQDTFRFNDLWSLQLGGRLSRTWSLNTRCDRKRRADNLVAADAALVCNPIETAKVYVKGSRFYRNPFLDENPYRYDAGYRAIPTEILRPEQGWNAEIGGESEIADEFSLGADAYATWLEDELFYSPLVGNNVNCDDWTFRRGLDLQAAWEREKVAGVTLSASYVKATFDGGAYGRNRIPLVPELTVSASTRVWIWNECFAFGGYRFQSGMISVSDFSNDLPGTEAFGLFHIGATYKPTFASWIEGFSLTVTVDNLLDENYCDYSTYGFCYWPGAGRSFTVTLRYTF